MNKVSTFYNENRLPILLASLAVVVRLIYLYLMSLDRGFLVPIVDERWHWEWAQQLIADPSGGADVFFRAPLYAYFLAFLSFITNGSIFWSKALQLLLSFGTSFYLFKLSEHLLGRQVAIISAMIYAFYGTLIFYESMFLIPVLFLFLTVWGIYRFIIYKDSMSIKSWAITGLILGLAVISRPNILLVIPFLLIWLVWFNDNKEQLLSRLKLPLVLVAGVLIPILPVTIKNYITSGDFILVSSQGGINLYLGNNPRATGLAMTMPEVQLNLSIGWNKFTTATTAAAERETGTTLSPGEASSFWSKKALKWMYDNPTDFLSLLWKKTTYLFNGFENSDNADIYFERKKSVLHSILVWNSFLYFPFGLLLPFFFVGLYVTRHKFKTLLPLYVYILIYIPSIILFLVTARHRLPIIIFMIIIASAGMASLFSKRNIKNMKDKLYSLAIFLVTLLIVNMSIVPTTQGKDFQNYYNEGLKSLRTLDYINAETAFLKADIYYKFSAPLLNNLGYSQYMLSKFDDASISLNRAIESEPSFSKSYYNLGLVELKTGTADSAEILFENAIKTFDTTISNNTELAKYLISLGNILHKSNNLDSARILYSKAVDNSDGDASLLYLSASFFARAEDYAKSDSLYMRAKSLRNPGGKEYYNWGTSYMKRNKWLAAIYAFQRSTRKDSTMYQSYFGIASAYYQENGTIQDINSRDSVNKYLDRTLHFNANFQQALQMKSEVDKSN